MRLEGSASKPRRHQRGQGLGEYAIVLVLIAIGTIGLVGIFGDSLRNAFGMSSQSLAGETTLNNRPRDVDGRRSMVNFGQYNSSGTERQ
jgi:Flp pilus assembly pilin Flp